MVFCFCVLTNPSFLGIFLLTKDNWLNNDRQGVGMVAKSHKLKVLQERHLLSILKVLSFRGTSTKFQLAKALGLSVSSTNELANRLIEQGWIIQDGVVKGNRGRNAKILRINPQHGFLLGIDLGRKTTKAVVTDLSLEPLVITVCETPFNDSREAILEQVLAVAREALKESGKSVDQIIGAGLGLAGQVHEQSGLCLNFFSKPEWNDFPIRDFMKDHLDIPFLITMWARGGALAEKWFGKARSVSNMLFVHIGSTISIGMIFDNKLYSTSSGVSGELGHMTALPNGHRCYCGNFGCLETVASEEGILGQVQDEIDDGFLTHINDYGRKPNFTYEDVVAAANQGDKLAFQVLEKTGEYLGTCIADVINLLSPDLVILGGHVFDKARQIIRTVEVTIRKRALETATRTARIEFTSFGADALALGAAAAVYECCMEPKNIFDLQVFTERLPLLGS